MSVGGQCHENLDKVPPWKHNWERNLLLHWIDQVIREGKTRNTMRNMRMRLSRCNASSFTYHFMLDSATKICCKN